MSDHPWFRWYPADYLADTRGLSDAEHGAYLLLLMDYYCRERPPPDNDRVLMRIACSASIKRWLSIRSAIEPFFEICDGVWHHKRVEAEITRRKDEISARKRGAFGSHIARAQHSAQHHAQHHAQQYAEHPQSDPEPEPEPDPNSNPESESESESEKSKGKSVGRKRRDPARATFQKPTLEEVSAYCRERGNGVNAEQWVNHYESNGWMVGKAPMKNWQAAVRTWENNGMHRGNGGSKHYQTETPDAWAARKKAESKIIEGGVQK